MNRNHIAGLVTGWLTLLLAGCANALAAAEPPAKWTVMIYMNGDNDLEEFAVGDFLEMAEVGSTSEVNIVVQFDRASELDYEFGTSSRFTRLDPNTSVSRRTRHDALFSKMRSTGQTPGS